MIDRLIFGCGRLTGGASEREALALVDACLEAGVRHFDTAPSYGLGTAEGVIGKVVRSGVAGLTVTAKVGSVPPRLGLAKTWARAARRLVTSERPRLGGFAPEEPREGRSTADFSESAMRASATRSCAALGQIDWLLLHEAEARHADPAVTVALDRIAAEHGARAGYSHGAMFSAPTDAGFPDGWIAQAAIRPEWLTGSPRELPERSLVLHSIALTGQWLADQDAGFANRLAAAAQLVESGDPATRRIAACYALASAHVPQAHLVVASSHIGRLRAVLAALGSLDAERCAAIAAAKP
jgi:hypothetical protein